MGKLSTLSPSSDASISGCENFGTITADCSGVGGIVGQINYLSKKAVISGCENSGAVSSPRGSVGGIAGQIVNNGEVIDCANSGSIGSTNISNVGGIVGIINGNAVIDGCTSNGAVTASSQAAGIAGGISGITDASAVVTISDCTNLSVITCVTGSAGGIVGVIDSNADADTITIESCSNGTSSETRNTFGTSRAFTGMGGIVGAIKNTAAAVNVNGCTNYSDISVSYNVTQMGGIVGYASTARGSVIISACENKGGVSNAAVTAAMTGGIAGSLGSAVRVNACVNSGAVSNSGGMGGIAGSITDTVILDDCKNEGTVAGGTNVGGIAGAMYDDTQATDCVNIGAVSGSSMTGGNTGYMTDSALVRDCQNIGTVTGASGTGGILGGCQLAAGASVERCYNFAMITGLSGISTVNYIGGITGMLSSKTNGGITVTQCINFGTVDLSANTSTSSTNIGGISGNTDSSAVLISYCVNSAKVLAPYASRVAGIVGRNKGEVLSCRNAVVDPDSYNTTGVASPAMLVVGTDDQIVGKDKVGGIAGENAVDLVGEIALIHSARHLATPNVVKNTFNIKGETQVGGIVGYNNGATIVGAYNKGRVTGTSTDQRRLGGLIGFMRGTAGNSTVAGSFSTGTFGSTTTADTYTGGLVGYRENRDTMPIRDSYMDAANVPQTTVSSYTGRWVVGNESYGTSYAGGVLDGPRDGDGNLILTSPVVLTDAEIEAYINDYEYQLDAPQITSLTSDPASSEAYTVSWKASKGEVSKFKIFCYDADHPSSLLYTGEAASSDLSYAMIFTDGSLVGKRFTVAMQAIGISGMSDDSSVSTLSAAMTIMPRQLTPEFTLTKVTDISYTLKITNTAQYSQTGLVRTDYPSLSSASAYDKYSNGFAKIVMTVYRSDGSTLLTRDLSLLSGIQTIDFSEVAEGASDDYTVQLQAIPSGAPYDYLCSQKAVQTVSVKHWGTLSKPVIDSALYTGDTSTASFAVQWSLPNAADADHITGYEVTVKDGTSTVLTQTVYRLSLSLNDLDAYLGHTLTVAVKALGDYSYYDSPVSDSLAFLVPFKLGDPVISLSRDDANSSYVISWAATGALQYQVVIIQNGDTSTEVLNAQMADTSYTLAYRTDEDVSGYTIDVSVTALGVLGSTLNSDENMYSFDIPGRLASVGSPDVRMQGEPQDLTYVISWEYEIPESLTELTCSGFKIVRHVDGETVAYETLEGAEAFDFSTTSFAYTLNASDAGKSIKIYVIALGKGQASLSSLPEYVGYINAPGVLPAPQNVSLSPVPSTNTLSVTNFEAQLFTLFWTAPEVPDSTVISGYEVEIVTGEGDTVAQYTVAAGVTSKSFHIPSDYSGQQLKARVRTVNTTSVFSEWAEKTMVMGKVTLDQATFDTCSYDARTGEYVIAFSDDQTNVSGYSVVVKDATNTVTILTQTLPASSRELRFISTQASVHVSIFSKGIAGISEDSAAATITVAR